MPMNRSSFFDALASSEIGRVESDTEVEVTTEVTAEEEMAEDSDTQEMDGEADGEGLEPRFEEENADTLSNE
ncbi:MAG: hypothetical protein AAF360_11265 [Pseudomonadota bacterium]